MLYIFFSACLFGCSDTRDDCDRISDRILSQLAKQMRKHNLYAIGSGGGCTLDNKINLISMVFKYDNILCINFARRLIVESTDALLQLVNSNPDNKEYFEIFPISDAEIYISIIGALPLDNNPDDISGVKIVKGRIRYTIDNFNPPPKKDGPLLTVHSETFEEAKKILHEQQSQ